MNQLRLASRAVYGRRPIVSILVFAYHEIAVPNFRNSKKLEFTLITDYLFLCFFLILYLVISLNVVNELLPAPCGWPAPLT